MNFFENFLNNFINVEGDDINQENIFTRSRNYSNREDKNDNKILKDLPVFLYRKVDRIKCKECPICLEKYKEGDFVPYFHCGHYFHYECFRECLKNMNSNEEFSCPVCRQKVMSQIYVNQAKEKRRFFLTRVFTL
jgi:hypothetical protein